MVLHQQLEENDMRAARRILASIIALALALPGMAFAEESYQSLLPSNPIINGYFGSSVSASGDTLVVAATNGVSILDSTGWTGRSSGCSPGRSAPGCAIPWFECCPRRRFARRGEWSGRLGDGQCRGLRVVGCRLKYTTTLVAPERVEGDLFGRNVAVEGNVIVAGAPATTYLEGSGVVHVFELEGTDWVHTSVLSGSGLVSTRYFGLSVAISGETMVVGAPLGRGDDDVVGRGEVYVFVKADGSWALEQLIYAPIGQWDFGIYVDVEGDLLAVAVDERRIDNWYQSGSAFAYRRVGSTWVRRSICGPT